MKKPDQIIWDHIVVGAGILGTVTAKYLKEKNPETQILLIDKYSTVGQGNTSKSNACFRNVFDTHLNIVLSGSSIDYYKFMENENKIDLGIQEFGYLWLLSDDQYNARNEKCINFNEEDNNRLVSFIEFLDLNNIEYKIITKNEIESILPLLKTTFNGITDEYGLPFENITYGLLGKQCGALEPDLLVKAYENSYKKLGGKCQYETKVIEILLKEKGKPYDPDYIPTIWRDSEIGAIKIRNHDRNLISILQTKNLIITTGAWINQLLDPIGINSTIKPKKRQLYRICSLNSLVENNHFNQEINSIPFIILPVGGVFLKPIPAANCVEVGCSDDIGRRFETRNQISNEAHNLQNKFLDDPRGEIDFYLYNILPVLESYFPTVFSEKNRIENPSAGMYAYSTDKFPVIERVEKLENLYFCSGASGSGIMKADSVGRIFAALISNQEFCRLFNGFKIKISDFSLDKRNLPRETLVL